MMIVRPLAVYLRLIPFLLLPAAVPVMAQVEAKRLFDPAAPDAAAQITPNDRSEADVTYKVDATGINVAVVANGKAGYPGIKITPPAPYDASNYGHIEAKVTNNGEKPIRVCLRVGNAGPWQENRASANVMTVKPGKSAIVSTIFGYNFGAAGYVLKPEAVTDLLFFTTKSDTAQNWRIEMIEANGLPGEKPYVDPNGITTIPDGGILLGGAPITAKQLVAKGNAKAAISTDGKSFAATLSQGGEVTFHPASGMWNLNRQLQVRVKLKNTGSVAITPTLQLTSRAGASDAITAAQAIAPGSTADIIIPFAAKEPWQGADDPQMHTLEFKKEFLEHKPGTGNEYRSCYTTGLVISTDKAAAVQVISVVAELPTIDPPEWLGKRPPVDGDWVQTFNDNFDGDHIDLTKWDIYTEGAWHIGANTHFSKDNAIVKDGKLILRVEKKPGHHNDDPAMPFNDYAAGYAETYGKWSQRYGYFEARMKLPTAPQMFNAFWLMPDRGLAAGPQNVRANTKEGGMEFDIMETLSIWGPYRHDFGMHWDGYIKYHKSTGMFNAYSPPDKEGFITVGMLWTPGLVVMYDNGKEAARWETSRISTIPSYFILDNTTGGWETEPFDDKQLPGDFVIDYVRAWQRKDLASPVDGPKPNDGSPYPPKADTGSK